MKLFVIYWKEKFHWSKQQFQILKKKLKVEFRSSHQMRLVILPKPYVICNVIYRQVDRTFNTSKCSVSNCLNRHSFSGMKVPHLNWDVLACLSRVNTPLSSDIWCKTLKFFYFSEHLRHIACRQISCCSLNSNWLLQIYIFLIFFQYLNIY